MRALNVLVYHRVLAERDPLLAGEPTAEEFEARMRWVASRYDVLPLLDAVRALRDGRLPARALSITFDDGYADFAELAWPVFRHNDLPVTQFVVSARVGGTSDWGGGTPVRPLVGWETLKKLVDKGLVLGSHGRTHRDLTKLSDQELADEIAGSADEIEKRAGLRPKAFSYPFGKCDERVRKVVAAHYEVACGHRLGVITPSDSPHELPRIDTALFRDPMPFVGWGGPKFRRALAWRGLKRRFGGAAPS